MYNKVTQLHTLPCAVQWDPIVIHSKYNSLYPKKPPKCASMLFIPSPVPIGNLKSALLGHDLLLFVCLLFLDRSMYSTYNLSLCDCSLLVSILNWLRLLATVAGLNYLPKCDLSGFFCLFFKTEETMYFFSLQYYKIF